MREFFFRGLVSFGILCVAGAVVVADPKVEEEEVGPVGQDVKYTVSPHGVHLASVARKGSRMVVIVDDAPGPKFDEIVTPTAAFIDPRPLMEAQRAATLAGRAPPDASAQPVTFSRDGKRFAYVGRSGQEWVLVVDGKESLRLPVAGMVGAVSGIAGSAGNTDLRLEFAGEDGKHLFFAKSAYNGYELWVDGQKMPGTYASGGGGTEGTVDPLITRDGTRFAYVAQIDRDKRTVIVDGTDAGYLADNLAFTADGKHLLGLVRQGGIVGLAVDGKVKIKTDGISQLVMAPVGNGFAAVLRRLNPPGEFLIVNAKKVEGSDCEQVLKVAFSPDAKHFAAVCKASFNVAFVIIDGKKGQQYDGIWQPDSLAYSADSSKVGYVARSANKAFVVINDDESDAFENTPNFLFSPDGKRVVMSGMQNKRNPQAPGGVVSSVPVFIDGKAERLERSPSFATFAFSPDNSRYGYTGSDPRGGGVYIDGKSLELSGNFNFSPDSKHVAVVGYSPKDNKRGLFVDGQAVYTTDNNYGVRVRAFTPDSQHLFWMALEPAKSGEPGAYEHVTYLDGKVVARCDSVFVGPFASVYPGGNIQATATLPAWNIGEDGTLMFVGPVGDEVKRFKITPSSDTSLATMMAAAQAVPSAKAAAVDPNTTAAERAKANHDAYEAKKRLNYLNAQRAKQGLPPLDKLPDESAKQ